MIDYLGWNWREGFRIFHDCLVDADLAINTMMWQNAGGSGCDQWSMVMWPTNGEYRDPEGRYVKRWCPELKRCSDLTLLFDPHQIDRRKHKRYKPVKAYPKPWIKDLEEARLKSMASVRKMRCENLQWNDPDGQDIIVLPNGMAHSVYTKADLRLPSHRTRQAYV